MRVEINFSGDSSEAVISSEEVTKAVRKLFVQAEETAQAVQEIKISSAQAAESSVAARRMANDIQQIGQEARKSRREIEALKLSGAGTRNPGSGFGPFGSGFGRVGVLGAAVGLGTVTSGPLGGGAAALGVGALGLTGGALGAVGVLVASFHGLGKAIEGDRQEFEKLSPATQTFVQDVRSLIPWLHTLQETARAGLLPGVSKGLHDALNPQTAGAIEEAIRGISGELGKLAEEAGRGLGGPQFREFLTDAGTHGVTQLDNLGDAAGHLASALLTLDHAGQPLTDWLTKVTDDGARFVDEWLKAADASGTLGDKLGGAQHELELIGQLVGALADAALQLGDDLTPLGNQIIVALTNALQGLSSWLQRNHDEVVAFTTGALNALIAAVQTAWPIVEHLAKALKAIVDAMGGWQVAFELVIGGAVVVGLVNITKAVYGLRTALLIANPELAILVGAIALITAAALDPNKFKEFPIPGSTGKVEYNEQTGTYARVSPPSGHGGRATKKPLTEKEAAALLGISVGELHGRSAPEPTAGTTGAGGGLALPTTFKATHDTMGADWAGRTPGPDAVDLMAKPGTKVLAPEDGQLTRISGHNPSSAPPLGQGGPWGRSFYFVGASGTVYYGTHLSDVAPIGSYKKGDVIAIIGDYPGSSSDHIHWAIVGTGKAAVAEANFASTQPSTLARGSGGSSSSSSSGGGGSTSAPSSDPFGTPPAFTSDKGANILPAALRLAIAKAGTTLGTTKDDRVAVTRAINWLKANVGGFEGEDQINAYLELASLLGQLKSLAPKVAKKPALASRAGKISARGEAAGLLDLLDTDPFKESTAQPQTLADAQKHLAAVRRTLTPEIRAIDKELGDKTLSAKTLATLRAQMGQYKKTITSAVDDVKQAVERQKAAFENAWKNAGDAVIAVLEQKRSSFKSPARQLLEMLTDQHDTKALQDALDQANDDLATALKGHQQDAQQQLDDITKYVGTAFLTNAIDAAQSAILGGNTVQLSGDEILKTLQGILTAGGNVVDPDEVKRAQQAVEDAKYAIQIAGLQKTADAEERAYNDQIDAQEAAIRQMQDNWEQYFATLKGNINAISGVWNQFLTSIGTNIQTAGVTANGGGWTGQVDANTVPVSAGFYGFDNNGNWVGGDISSLPSFDVGGHVPNDMLAQVHGGEYVVPKGGTLVKGGGGGVGDVTVVFEGNIPEDWVKVQVVKNAPAISRALGRRAADRQRSNRT